MLKVKWVTTSMQWLIMMIGKRKCSRNVDSTMMMRTKWGAIQGAFHTSLWQKTLATVWVREENCSCLAFETLSSKWWQWWQCQTPSSQPTVLIYNSCWVSHSGKSSKTLTPPLTHFTLTHIKCTRRHWIFLLLVYSLHFLILIGCK